MGKLSRGGQTSIVDLIRGASPSTRLKQERNTTCCFISEYSVKIPTREEWSAAPGPLGGQKLIWYTDRSKTEEGSGAQHL